MAIEPASVVRNAETNISANEPVVYTTPATGNFFLTSASISLNFYITQASSSVWRKVLLKATIDGTVREILTRAYIYKVTTLEHGHVDCELAFTNPIKVDPGTNIVLAMEGIGNSNEGFATANITGYTSD